jgi:Zn-dependent protease with chaperone function
MKIVYRQPKETADTSSARGTAGRELGKLLFSAVVLLIVLFFTVGWIVDFVVSRISFDTEARIFKQVRFAAEDAQGESDSAHLQSVGAILEKLQGEPVVPPLPYRLVVIQEAEPNAFAFPGGTIGVTTGLLDLLDEEIAMAFVLGHELGHFHNRDHLQGMGRTIGFRIIMAMIFGTGDGAESFGNMIEFVFQRGYSQEVERAADRFGLELVHTAYGKTGGVDRFFHIISDGNTMPAWAYMFSTHPSPQSRIQDLKSYADLMTETRWGTSASDKQRP